MAAMDDDYCKPSEIAVSILFVIWIGLTGWAYARPSFFPPVEWEAGQDPLPDFGCVIFYWLAGLCALALTTFVIGRFEHLRPWLRAIGFAPLIFQPFILIQKLLA
jgi:hypothetical protein